jgi:hypothetical protein
MTSTVDQNFEQLSYGGPSLSQHRAAARKIIGDGVATRTLVAKESGAICLFDTSTGVVYTLPSPQIGMFFEFITTVAWASGTYKFVTNLSTEFLVGAVTSVNSGATTGEAFLANGTTHRAVTMAGTTTGGFTGDRFRVVAISSTQWALEGVYSNTGTAATPMTTS